MAEQEAILAAAEAKAAEALQVAAVVETTRRDATPEATTPTQALVQATTRPDREPATTPEEVGLAATMGAAATRPAHHPTLGDAASMQLEVRQPPERVMPCRATRARETAGPLLLAA